MNTAVDTQVDTYAPCQMGNMRCKLVAGLSLSFLVLNTVLKENYGKHINVGKDRVAVARRKKSN